jgi:dTDP-4-dehydrorhamnose 3,5-epimerase-like enzyme
VIDGLELIPLHYRRDERGWLLEVRRESSMRVPTKQTNVSFSRQGVIRGLHYHERGQDDLFTCLLGTARVVVLDRESGEVFAMDVGEETRSGSTSPAGMLMDSRPLRMSSSVTT